MFGKEPGRVVLIAVDGQTMQQISIGRRFSLEELQNKKIEIFLVKSASNGSQWPDFSVSAIVINLMAFKYFKNNYTEKFSHKQNK